MLDHVPARSPRGPVRDVDGSMIRALRKTLGLSLMDFGSELGKEKGTIQRWEKGWIDEITWRGVLVSFKKSLDWEPEKDVLENARRDVNELRAAASTKKPPKKRHAH